MALQDTSGDKAHSSLARLHAAGLIEPFRIVHRIRSLPRARQSLVISNTGVTATRLNFNASSIDVFTITAVLFTERLCL